MSAKTRSKVEFDYIAHVQKADQTVVELAGSMTSWTQATVYQALLQKAIDLGGWLLSNHINERDVDEPDDEAKVVPMIDRLIEHAAVVDETTASVLDDESIFGVYEATYKGASLCTYKETGT